MSSAGPPPIFIFEMDLSLNLWSCIWSGRLASEFGEPRVSIPFPRARSADMLCSLVYYTGALNQIHICKIAEHTLMDSSLSSNSYFKFKEALHFGMFLQPTFFCYMSIM